MNIQKIDQRREAIGKQWCDFVKKLQEWSVSASEDAAKFVELTTFLYKNNLKMLCTLVGKCLSPIEAQINAKDNTIFTNKIYTAFLNSEILKTGNANNSFDFSLLFNAEEKNQWTPEIHEQFWKRLQLIVKFYKLLVEIDSEMKEYDAF